jgi:hypothetical protein
MARVAAGTGTRRWLGKAGLLCLGCLVGLCLVELGVRLLVRQPILPRFVRDPGYGVRDNIPAVRCRHIFPGDYDVRITTNEDGLRGSRPYARRKAAGVSRVAVVGDSFPFGFGVNDSEVVSEVLESQLSSARSAGKRWEVLNFGVPGFGQAEELVQYQNKVREYSPDWVVLFYFDNDIGNNAVSGLFAVRPDGSVERIGREFLPGVRLREKLYAIAPIRWLFMHSQLWNYARNQLSGRVQARLLEKQDMKAYEESTPKSVQLTRALLAESIREVKSAGAKCILFIIPNSEIKSNFPMARGEVEQLGALWIDGRDFLQPQDYYARDCHWRAEGHKKAAAALLKVVGG